MVILNAALMPKTYVKLQDEIRHSRAAWVVTGVAGFIGSNLLERLLRLDPPEFSPAIEMDYFDRAMALLPGAASAVVNQNAQTISDLFLHSKADPYVPQNRAS